MWFFEELIGVDLSYFLKKTVFLDQFVMEFFVAEWLGGASSLTPLNELIPILWFEIF